MPITLLGIEPATVRLVAWCLNQPRHHCLPQYSTGPNPNRIKCAEHSVMTSLFLFSNNCLQLEVLQNPQFLNESQKFSGLYYVPKDHDRVHRSPPLVLYIHVLSYCSFNIPFNIILPPTHRFSKWFLSFVRQIYRPVRQMLYP